jgi:DNA-binding NarL/FixJ family response regulator
MNLPLQQRHLSSELSTQENGDAPELPPPWGLTVSVVELDHDQYLVLSFPAPTWELPECLTAAEREIVLAMLRGASNEAIARVRRTSIRTVANQIASIFVKLRVSSRIELAHVLGTSHPCPNTARTT